MAVFFFLGVAAYLEGKAAADAGDILFKSKSTAATAAKKLPGVRGAYKAPTVGVASTSTDTAPLRLKKGGALLSKALLRLCEGSVKALLRLYEGFMKAVWRHCQDPIKGLLMLY